MTENEIIEQIERIHNICECVIAGMAAAKKEGRMPSLIEAKEMDRLSQELARCILDLPPRACEQLQNHERRQWGGNALAQAKDALKSIVQPPSSGRSAVPRAASGSLGSYNRY
jgi:hypothetical protein